MDKCGSDTVPLWGDLVKKGFEEKYIKLMVYSYEKMVTGRREGKPPWENTRRNQLCAEMRKHKKLFGITFNIVAESGTWSDEYQDKGRIDICCYINELEDIYIAFECKRLLKRDITPGYIRENYYGQGIRRFEDGTYEGDTYIGGMVAFLETGNYEKLRSVMGMELPKYAQECAFEDLSAKYAYNYIYGTKHRCANGRLITLSHILMNFT